MTKPLLRPTILSFVIAIAISASAFGQSTTAAGGGAFTLVVKSDGTLWAFGLNNNGQIADGTTTTRKSPQQVAGLANIQTVAAGGVHAMALTSSGSLYVWGDNLYGQVGDATTTDRKTPVLLGLSNVTAIAAGEFHSLALTSSGDVYAWGRNNFGQIGNGNTTNVNTPTLVLTGAIAIGAGRNHSLAVKSDGSAWAWGANGSGQLGTNTTSTGATSSPVQMMGITNGAKIAGGEAHSFIILSDATVKGAGENGAGQLADGTSTDRWSAITVGALSNVTHVVSGLDHAFALRGDGSVAGWGENSNGELGLGTSTDAHATVEVTSLSGISAVAAGWNHSIAVDTSGVVSTWGTNGSSQLGDGTTTPRAVPVPISENGYAWRVATPVFSVASGTYNVDKTVTMTVDTVGATIYYTQDGSEPTESSASGSTVTVSYSQTLKARAWKLGMPAGEIAVATYTLQVATPTVSPTATTYTTPQNVTMATTTPGATLRYTIDGTDPTESSTAYTGTINVAHTTAFRIAGFKSGWTTSAIRASTYTMNFGTLGAPTVDPETGSYTGSVSVTMSSPQSGATIRYTTNNTAPTATSTAYSAPIPVGTTTTIRAKVFHPDYTASAETSRIYTVTTHTPTLSTAAGSYTPGSTVTITAGQPLTDTLRMTIDGNDPTTTSPTIASGTTMLLGNFTLNVKAWRTGALDSAIAGATYTVTGPLGPGSAAAGGTHSVIATPDGRVIAWGENGNGQIGNESTVDRTTPTTLNTISGVTQVAGGLAHTLARTWDGQVYAWGSNASGRLGDGTTTQRTRPTLIPTLSNVAAVAAGDAHSLALTSDGYVYAWGANASGELGLGHTTATLTPTLIPALSDIVGIAAGDAHSLAVTSTGNLYAWGNNGSSRLGDGSTTNRTSPVLINLSNVASVAAGAAHSLAKTSNGDVYAWGLNTYGQLGLGNTTLSSTPTLIDGLQASMIDAGDNFSAAVRGDGVLVAWGLNSSGQLGDTTTTQRNAPVVVSGPSSISSIALGDAFSMVVTTTGAVWTWGAGASGQLGEGTTLSRSVPTPISESGYAWRVATPVFNPASGTFTADKPVIVTVDTPDAIIHYTQNGADPTESDPAVASGSSITVTSSQTLKAKAWKSGMAAGEVAAATIVMQVATPTVSPTATTYTTPQNVIFSTTTPGATIRYTTDGSDPTESSAWYSGPIEVAHTTAFRIAGFKSGWSTSGIRASTYTMNFGTLAAPTVDPAAGSYTGSVSVTMSSPQSGATIRYTTNNTAPSATSPIYSDPIPVNTTQTIRAKVFHPDYATSAETSQAYIIAVDTPILSVATGNYAPGSVVVITAADAALDTLRMTIDGTNPTSSSELIASGKSLILGNFTLTVKAFRSGATESAIASATYTLTAPLGPGSVTGGGAHTMVATPDGRVYAWGANTDGQLGNRSATNQTTPVLLSTITGVIEIAGGLSHTLARTWDGQIHAWGSNGSGRLGVGSSPSVSTSPLQVSTLANVIAVAAGDSHSLALTSDGRVYAWGGNSAGQLGLGDRGTGTERYLPTEIPSLSNIVAISAGDNHSFAVTNAGQLYAWGSNGQLRLGFGTAGTFIDTPTLTGLNDVLEVAAGQFHSLALTNAGSVYEWGARSAVGIGQPAALVPDLTAVAIAAGDDHSAAIGLDGKLVLWGENASGQIGNDSVQDVSVPTPVTDPSSISLVGLGDLHSVAITPSGEVWTWGESGAGRLGNGTTTPDVLSPQLVITAASLWPAAAPAIDPPTGNYTSAQMVSMTSPDPAASIKYTVDGSTPTETSTNYSGPFEVNTTTTIKARAYVSSGAPSIVSTSVLTFVLGTLSPPTASPAGGIRQSVQVALTADEGTTIRYTLDGTTPTASSDAYASPISITSGVVPLKAKAFKTGWVDSTVMSEAYNIDNIPPTQVANLFPSPINGWSNTPVTITFFCTDNLGVADCPAPVIVSSEGAAQDVSRLATDLAGNQSSAGAVLNIDLTGPVVALSSPANGLVTTTGLTTLTATVSDAVSGVVSATCNGVSTSVTNGQVSCDVALRNGVNSLVVTARDAAGNSGSAGVRVTRVGTATTFVLAPSTETKLIGDEFNMSLRDDFGIQVDAATWQTSDAGVVSVSTDDPPLLTAIGAGTATITATKNGLSATATVTVLAGDALPDGTVKWSIDNLGTDPISADSLDPDGPASFTSTFDNGEWAVHALSADGRQLWTEAAPGQPVMSDHVGALVAFTGSSTGLARFAGPEEALPWRHQVIGTLLTYPAQSADGTIYVIDHQPATSPRGAAINDAVVLAIDGNSGALKYRYALPRSRFVYDSIFPDALANGCTQPPEEYGVSYSAPVIGSDGRAYVTVAPHDVHVNRRWINNACVDAFVEYENRIKLIALSSSGAVTTLDVLNETNTACSQVALPKQVLTDGGSGIVITSITNSQCSAFEMDDVAYKTLVVNSAGAVATFPSTPGYSIAMTSDTGTAYLLPTTGGNVVAKDLSTGATKYTAPVAGTPLAPHADDGLTVRGNDGLVFLDGNGSIMNTTPLAVQDVRPVRQGLYQGTNGTTGAVESVTSATIPIEARSHFSWPFGRPSQQRSAQAGCATNIPFSSVKPPAGPNVTYHIDGSFDDRLHLKVQVLDAIALWNMANQSQGLNIQFVPAPQGQTPDLTIYNGLVQQGFIAWTEVTSNPNTGRILPGAEIGITDQSAVMMQTEEMYRKAALHELGHMMGLGHTPRGRNRPTVMNGISHQRDDREGWVSMVVTVCDAEKAKAADSRVFTP